MPVDMTINDTGTSRSSHQPSAKVQTRYSPLIEHIDSANTSPIELNRPSLRWMPERMLEWLKNQWWHRLQQLPTDDCEKAAPQAKKYSLEQAIAGQDADRRKESSNCLAWTLGLLTLGVSASAFAAYTWLRLKNDAASGANRIALRAENESIFAAESYPLFQALIADEPLPQTATQRDVDTTTVKKRPARRRNNMPTCKSVAALARCEELRAQHIHQKPGILMLKENNQTCRCPAAGVATKSETIFNEVLQPDPQEQLPAGVQIKDSPAIYFPDKAASNSPTEPPGSGRNKKSYIHSDTKQQETATEAAADDVKIERLYDFSCIEARNNMKPEDNFRAIADALTKPITGLAKEIQIIYSHNIAGKGCPTSEAVNTLQSITDPIDVAVNNIISLFPGMRVPALLQNVVGPTMQMLVDQYEGKEIDPARFNEVSEQFIALMRPVIPTLSSAEQVSLYNKLPGAEKSASAGRNSILHNRVALRDGTPQVQVEGEQYKLQTIQEATPFVIDNNQSFHLIRYDNIHDRWAYVAGEEAWIYSEQAQAEIDKYSLPLAGRSEESHFITGKDNELVTFSSPGKPDITGVFVGGKFIPAKWEMVNDNQVAVTNMPGQDEKRVLVYNSFGWSFEQPSVKKDKYLRMLLQDPNTDIPLDIRHTPDNSIAPINKATGFSDSVRYGKLIKEDNKYFRVISSHNEKANSDTDVVMGYNDAVVEYDAGMLKLRKSADIAFALRNEADIPRPNLPVSLRVEKGTLDYLIRHAKTTSTQPLYAMHNGLFRDADGEAMFIFQGKHYPVSKYENNIIYIPHHAEENVQDIGLWLDGDTWVRIREERNKTPIKYEEAATCRIARAPNAAKSCAPIMIEMDLHKQLTNYIDKDLTTNKQPVAENLSQSDVFDIPVLFYDASSMKHYFLYNNRYFDAEVMQASEPKNPTGLPCVKITGKGNIFRRKSDIATIVIEKAADKYYIKTQEAFLAEKLNIDKNVADAYLQNRPYRDVAEINSIEELTNEVQEARKIFVTKPVRKTGPTDLTVAGYAKQQESAKNILFSERVNQNSDKYNIKFFSLDTDTNSLNPFEQKAMQHIKARLKYVKEKVLNNGVSATYFAGPQWPGIAGYFTELLPDSPAQKQLTADFTASLQHRQERMYKALDEKKVFLVTAHEQSEPALTDRLQSVLPPGERVGEAGFMSEDGDGRLFINIDKLDFDGAAASAALADPVTVIMQAASHTKGMSADIIDLPKSRGINPPVQDFISQLASQLEEQTLPTHQLDTLIEVSKAYVNNIAPYRRAPSSLLTSKGLAYLLKNDPGYRAHVLLNTSTGITTLSQDIYYWKSMSDNNLSAGWIDPWMKRFGIARGDLSDSGEPPLVSTSHLELASLTPASLDSLSIHEVHGKKQIFYAQPSLDLLFKYNDNYYPVEFVGSSNKIINLGHPNEMRQLYYYDNANGHITPVQTDSPFNNLVTYNRNLDLFETQHIETGATSVLKFDDAKGTLIDTGARTSCRC